MLGSEKSHMIRNVFGFLGLVLVLLSIRCWKGWAETGSDAAWSCSGGAGSGARRWPGEEAGGLNGEEDGTWMRRWKAVQAGSV